ncbi:MAG: class I SAM-dependent methyltransferase [Cellvibrionaceae bacterium]|nr:class I SAM-dependent methyltransferase [Cellvibrionaceae bacterium]
MSGFSVEWLDLREPADSAARDGELLQLTRSWLQRFAAPIVLDLGAGTGSTLRAVSSAQIAQATWRLVDLDDGLLREAVARHGKTYALEIYRQDLNRIDQLPFAEVSLVTASAFFDLASAAFCDALMDQLVERRIGLYAALNYDGITRWSPAHPLDETVLAAFNRDQLRDKGMGPALGSGATEYLVQRLRKAGFAVHTADSPWCLSGEQKPLVENLVEGIANAVAADLQMPSEALQDWRIFRLQSIGGGTCVVGHQDLLALPPA